MKRKWRGLLLAIGVALGLMAFRKQAPPDLSSPKAAVRSFLGAVKSQDMATIQQCIQGATNQNYLKTVFNDISRMQVVSVNSLVAETENNTALVAAQITMQVPSSPQPGSKLVPVTMVDMFSLVKQGETWQLKPDPAFTNIAALIENGSADKLFESRPLSFAVAFAGTPALEATIQKAQASAQAASCLSNAKQIDLAVRMYTQDYDDVAPRKGIAYNEIVYPYIKNREVFTCPLDPKGTLSYTFNTNIAGVPLTAIPSPAKTVMIYEGKAGKLDFRHDGAAVVGFMDGHCKFIRPEETASLIWTVKLPKPAVKATPTKKKGHN